MRDRAMTASPVGPLIEGGQRRLVANQHGAFGGELAQRNPQPGPGRSVVHDGADLEVEELTDPQARAAQHLQSDPGERVGHLGDGGHQPRVDVRR